MDHHVRWPAAREPRHELDQGWTCSECRDGLCELVALACLVAHGDGPALRSHKVGRSWSADDIFDKMSKLNPDFFPIGITKAVSRLPTGITWHDTAPLDPQPFDKSGLLELYGKTHRFLHRGTLKKLLASEKSLDVDVDAEAINQANDKLCKLLFEHMIFVSKTKILTCRFGPLADGQVNVAMGHAEPEQSPL